MTGTVLHGRTPIAFICAATCILLLACQSNRSEKKDLVPGSLPVVPLPAPPPLPTAMAEKLRSACTLWFDSALKQSGFNGGMIVAKKGNIIFERYQGTVHLPGKDTINSNTPMQIASTSKTFTAMAVLKLYQDGKLGLDDEFSKYFPRFNYPGVTIRNLLSHRSGLPNYIYFMENLGWDPSKYMTNQDVLDWLVGRKSEIKDLSPPDTHFSYCNTNYALLALLVEKVSRKTLPLFLKETFFDPLQMKNSFVCGLPDTTKMQPSYDWRGRVIPLNFLDAVYGDKNVYTTPRDLLQWDRGLSSGLIFRPETLEQAYTPYSNERPGIRNYGLGWRMDVYPDGKKIIYHNGWWHGSNACFIRLLQDSATIILIGNRFTRAIYHAKILANLFNSYYDTEDEEEGDNTRPADTLSVLPDKPVHMQSSKKKDPAYK
jgi:CubicO group peptidase (beta-lactamase class C family)